MRHILSQSLIGEHVSVITTLKTTIETENGQILHAPIIVSGTVLDYDDECMLLGPDDGSDPKIIFRSKIAIIDFADTSAVLEEIMSDPSKPSKKDMS